MMTRKEQGDFRYELSKFLTGDISTFLTDQEYFDRLLYANMLISNWLFEFEQVVEIKYNDDEDDDEEEE